MSVRVSVNHEVCEANGICEDVAGDIFHLRDDDILAILMPKPDTEELIEKAREAFRRSPKAALTIHES